MPTPFHQLARSMVCASPGGMGNEFKGRQEHSAEYFGDTRDHWWNRDFLELVVRRLRLDEARDVLDVGCGIGHWGLLLASLLPEHVRFAGVEREPRWVAEAAERASARGLGARCRFTVGEAEHLPFADDSFDLTTCQTVLIHLPRPELGLAEMKRVTKPGGLVVVAEPSNLAEALLLDSISNQSSVDDIVELVRFQVLCERGKVALGLGDNSLGNRVVGLFAAQGFKDIEVRINDRASPMFPPYDTREQQLAADEMRDRAARQLWIWDEAETRRYFLAGGGAERDFSAHFARGLAAAHEIVEGLDAGTYYGSFGGGFYLVAGRK